jgi:nicotinate phosphoribosyltransferase
MKDSDGIGTWLTCNFDKTERVEALDIKNKNIVIKLVGFKYSENKPWHDCVKLSCDPGKTLGNPEKCEYLLNQLNKK